MATWTQFTAAAPRVAEVFRRRHAAAGRLCLLGTLRPDGFPRISPLEPAVVDGDLLLTGMSGTAKFRDLVRDPRFTLHTATVDPQVGDGDAKIWGTVVDVPDQAAHRRFTEALFAETGFDLRDEQLEHLFRVDVVGASAVEIVDGHLDITVWREGTPERVVRKH